MTSTIAHKGFEVDAIDLFAGFGGSSQGITKAGATVKLAANHKQLAIDCHAVNYPNADHVRADLYDHDAADYIDPQDLPPAVFVWASPSCKHHSKANAQKLYDHGPGVALDDDEQERFANSERSRATMLCPLRYAAKHRPEIVIVENVVEVCQWGPKQPGKKTGDGSTFRWWLNEWVKLGYDYECKFLNSMFFPPCPQSRDRMYVVIWRKGNKVPDLDHRPMAVCTSEHCAENGQVVRARQTWKKRTAAWPLPLWGKYREQYTYTCPSCLGQVSPLAYPVYTAIDWTNLGPTIGDRLAEGKTLADNTIQRIKRGMAKFGGGPPVVIPGHGATSGITTAFAGNTHERPTQVRSKSLHSSSYTQHTTKAFGFAHTPFITEMRNGGSMKSRQYPISRYAHGATAGGFHHGLATPPAMFAKFNGGPADTAWHHVGEPANAITSRDTTGLVVLPWIDQFQSDPRALCETLGTVTTHQTQAYCAAESWESWEDVSDDDLLNIHYRMFAPDPELRRVMAFADDYILLGNQTEMCEGLGNAVTPTVAEWLTEQALATLRGSSQAYIPLAVS